MSIYTRWADTIPRCTGGLIDVRLDAQYLPVSTAVCLEPRLLAMAPNKMISDLMVSKIASLTASVAMNSIRGKSDRRRWKRHLPLDQRICRRFGHETHSRYCWMCMAMWEGSRRVHRYARSNSVFRGLWTVLAEVAESVQRSAQANQWMCDVICHHAHQRHSMERANGSAQHLRTRFRIGCQPEITNACQSWRSLWPSGLVPVYSRCLGAVSS